MTLVRNHLESHVRNFDGKKRQIIRWLKLMTQIKFDNLQNGPISDAD